MGGSGFALILNVFIRERGLALGSKQTDPLTMGKNTLFPSRTNGSSDKIESLANEFLAAIALIRVSMIPGSSNGVV